MRWPVAVILDMLGSGMSNAQILEEHPELEPDDIKAALYYAQLAVSGQTTQEVA
jgi:uncharacterized protein (DUF433 family)